MLEERGPQAQARRRMSRDPPAHPKAGQVLPSSGSLPGPGRPRAAAWPRRARAWEKSFQTALLGADWPRRTRSRGEAANGRRPPRARGWGRWPEARAAQSAAAAAARPRGQARVSSGLRWPGVGAARPGTAATAGETLQAALAPRRALGTPGSRLAGNLLRPSLARRFPAALTPRVPGAGLKSPALGSLPG